MEKLMALKRLSSGQYVIKSAKEAAAAMAMFQTLVEEVEQIREENGLKEIEEDQIELKRAVTAYMVENEISDIKIPDRDGMYGKLIEQGYDKRVIATADELAEYVVDGKLLVQPNVVPLRKVLAKKFGKGTKEFKAAWKRATKPVADVAELEQMVAEGKLTVKELSKCYAEKKKTPYLRIFGKGD
jgi:hypothetical protein